MNFREELQRLPYELPSIFERVGNAICSDEISAALAYHRALQEYLQNCEPPAVSVATSTSSSKKDKKRHAKSSISATDSVTDSFSDSFATVHTPFAFFSAIEELRVAKDEVVDDAVNLDFETEAAEINWDFSIADSGSNEGATIDWGIETVPDDAATTSSGELIDPDTPVEIDWDISSSDVGESVDDSVNIGGAVAADPLSSLGVRETAASDEPTRVGLLSENEFRTRIQNDLLELRTFLRQRKEELKGNDNVAFANQFQGSSGMLHMLWCSFVWLD